MKFSTKSKQAAAIWAICLAVYNIVLFVIAGFEYHEPTFWISWGFTMVAFLAMAVVGLLMGKNGMLMRDWLFGYPIVKHTTLYIIIQLVVSTLFIVLESAISTAIAVAVQVIILGVYLVFAISCFLAKKTIQEIKEKVDDKTRFIKLLRTDAEMITEKCGDAALKEKLRKFAEDVRFSDPMSSEALFELEKELTLTVSDCDKAVSQGNYAEAEELLNKATLQLLERNKKCKALK